MRPTRAASVGGASAAGWSVLVLGLGVVCAVTGEMLVNDPGTYNREQRTTGDVRRWHAISNAPGVRYRDVRIEYPPLTWAAVFVLLFESAVAAGGDRTGFRLVPGRADLLTAAASPTDVMTL